MSIETPEELAAMRRVGALVAETLRELCGEVQVGVMMGQPDALAARVVARIGAERRLAAPASQVERRARAGDRADARARRRGARDARRRRDGRDRRRLASAHVEHTIVVRGERPLVLTG